MSTFAVMLSRRYHRLTTIALLVAYFMGTAVGGLLHDHDHSNGHAQHDAPVLAETGYQGHGGHHHHRCAGHHHAKSVHNEAGRESAGHEQPQPLHDDDCSICRFLGQLPLATPSVEIVDIAGRVTDLVVRDGTAPAASAPRLHHSRAPPVLA